MPNIEGLTMAVSAAFVESGRVGVSFLGIADAFYPKVHSVQVASNAS